MGVMQNHAIAFSQGFTSALGQMPASSQANWYPVSRRRRYGLGSAPIYLPPQMAISVYIRRKRWLIVILAAAVALGALACDATKTDGFHFTAVNQTREPLTVRHTPAWAQTANGKLLRPGSFDTAASKGETTIYKVELPQGRNRRGITEISDLVLQPGESVRFRTEWDVVDGSGSRTSAAHRFVGTNGDHERVVDLFWGQLEDSGFTVVFTR